MITLIAYLSFIIRWLDIVKVYLNSLLPKEVVIYIIMPKELYIRRKLKKFCKFFQIIYRFK